MYLFIYLFISNKVKIKIKVILASTKDFCFGKNFTIVHNLTGHHTKNSQHSQTSILHFRVQCSQLLGTLIVHLHSKISSSKVSRSLLIIIILFFRFFRCWRHTDCIHDWSDRRWFLHYFLVVISIFIYLFGVCIFICFTLPFTALFRLLIIFI